MSSTSSERARWTRGARPRSLVKRLIGRVGRQMSSTSRRFSLWSRSLMSDNLPWLKGVPAFVATNTWTPRHFRRVPFFWQSFVRCHAFCLSSTEIWIVLGCSTQWRPVHASVMEAFGKISEIFHVEVDSGPWISRPTLRRRIFGD